MKITICGSCAFINEMEKLSERLFVLGYDVKFPPTEENLPSGKKVHTLDYYAHKKKTLAGDQSFWETHQHTIRNHLKKVEWSEAVLIANYDKNGIVNYIGPNTLIEMGLAFYLGKKIFLLNPIPEISYKEEILGLQPIVLNGDLSKLGN
jgi:hypothetical protein